MINRLHNNNSMNTFNQLVVLIDYHESPISKAPQFALERERHDHSLGICKSGHYKFIRSCYFVKVTRHIDLHEHSLQMF